MSKLPLLCVLLVAWLAMPTSTYKVCVRGCGIETIAPAKTVNPAQSILRAMVFLANSHLTGVAAAGGTPTLVYDFYSNGMSQPAGGLSTAALTIALERKSLANNCLVLCASYDSGDSISSVVDDQGQTWTAISNSTVDGGAGNVKTSMFVKANTAAGVQQITVNASSTTHFTVWYWEFYNVVTSSPVVQAKNAQPTGSTVATGNFSTNPISGNLILHIAISQNGLVGNQSANVITAFTAGSGFTRLGGNYDNETNNPFAVQYRIASSGVLNPTMTLAQVSHDVFNTVAIELTSASAGTAPSVSGIRILSTHYFVHITASDTFTQPFPYRGDLLVLRTTINGTANLVTDSNSNTWVWDWQTSGDPKVQHLRIASSDHTLDVTLRTTTQANCTFLLNDIINSNTTQNGATAENQGTTGSSDTEITAAPTITPSFTNSLILVTTSIGHGPLTNLHSPTPAGAIFGVSLYPEETDFDTLCNADGYAAYENGASLSAVNFTWRWNVNPGSAPAWVVGSAESWQAVAVEYRA